MALVGREPQLEELARAAGFRWRGGAPPDAPADEALQSAALVRETAAPLVVVYGGASTGKSAGAARVLRRQATAFALVDCAAVYNAQDFYREVLAQLYKNAADQQLQQPSVNADGADGDDAVVVVGKDGEGPDSFEGYTSLNFLAFTKALSAFVEASGLVDGATVYLALDHVDKLLDRGLAALLTCVFTINEQLGYANIFDDAPPWNTCVLLITRGVSAALDRLISPFFPVYINFPPYTPDQVVAILTEQLGFTGERRAFRRWALYLHGLLPPSAQDDWLEFRACVVHLLTQFREKILALERELGASTASTVNDLPNADSTPSKPATPMQTNEQPSSPVVWMSPRRARSPTANGVAKRLLRDTSRQVSMLLKTRRRHLFGYDKTRQSSAAIAAIGEENEPRDSARSSADQLRACESLSRSCLLLVVAGYLASFNPQESDAKFLSSAGGPRRKKRKTKKDQTGEPSATLSSAAATAPQHISQRLIGPKIFTLQRLLAIYLSLREEVTATEDPDDVLSLSKAAREDIFTHLATLVRMQLFQRTSAPNMLDDMKFRCLADWQFVKEATQFLQFPIDSYLNS